MKTSHKSFFPVSRLFYDIDYHIGEEEFGLRHAVGPLKLKDLPERRRAGASKEPAERLWQQVDIHHKG